MSQSPKQTDRSSFDHKAGMNAAATEEVAAQAQAQDDAPELNDLSMSSLGSSLQDYYNSALSEEIPSELLSLIDDLDFDSAAAASSTDGEGDSAQPQQND